MAEPGRPGVLGAITALAALITAATSLYVALREPPTTVSAVQGPAIAAPAPAWREEEPRRQRYERRRDLDLDAARAAHAARYDRFDEDPDYGFDEAADYGFDEAADYGFEEDADECVCDPAPFLGLDRHPRAQADLRSVVDRYNRFARDIIDSIGR